MPARRAAPPPLRVTGPAPARPGGPRRPPKPSVLAAAAAVLTLALAAVALGACGRVPEGRFRCSESEPCPDGWVCRLPDGPVGVPSSPLDDGRRCFRGGAAAPPDGGATVPCVTASDCADDGDPCTEATCEPPGVCTSRSVPGCSPPAPPDGLRVVNGVLVGTVDVEVAVGGRPTETITARPFTTTRWVPLAAAGTAVVRVSTSGAAPIELMPPAEPGRHTLLVTATYSNPPGDQTRAVGLQGVWLSEDVPVGTVRVFAAMEHRTVEVTALAGPPLELPGGSIADLALDAEPALGSFALRATNGDIVFSRTVSFYAAERPIPGGTHVALLGSAFAHPGAPHAPVALTWSATDAPRALLAEPDVVLVSLVDAATFAICSGAGDVSLAVDGRAGALGALPLVAALEPWSVRVGACGGAAPSLSVARPSRPGRVICAGSGAGSGVLACFEDAYQPPSPEGAPFLTYLNATGADREVSFFGTATPLATRAAPGAALGPLINVAPTEVAVQDATTRYTVPLTTLGDADQLYLLAGGPRLVALFAPGGAALETRVLGP